MSDDHTIEEVFTRGARTLAGLSPAGATPPWDALADLAPTMGRQVAMAFGSVMSRPGLELGIRELATVCMLATLGGCDAQVAFHVGGALRAGVTAPEVVEALTQVSVYAGIPKALNAINAARPVFAEFGVDPVKAAPRAVAAAFLTALAAGDWTGADAWLAPDVTCVLPGDPDLVPWAGTWEGRAGLARLRAAVAAALEIDGLLAHELLSRGRSVVARLSVVLRERSGSAGRTQDVLLELSIEEGQIQSLRWYATGVPIALPFTASGSASPSAPAPTSASVPASDSASASVPA